MEVEEPVMVDEKHEPFPDSAPLDVPRRMGNHINPWPNTGAFAIMGTVDPESFDTLHR